MAKLLVKVTCENCNHHFSYDVPLPIFAIKETSYWDKDTQSKITGASGITSDAAVRVAQNNARNRIEKCPNCGYVQSWMVSGSRKINRINGLFYILIGVGAAVVFGLILLGINKVFGPFDSPTWWTINQILILGPIALGSLAMIAAFLGVLDFLVNPNHKFKKPEKFYEPVFEEDLSPSFSDYSNFQKK